MHSFGVRTDVITFFRFWFVKAETINIKLPLALENLFELMLSKVLKISIDFNDCITYLLPADFPLLIVIEALTIVVFLWAFFLIALRLLLWLI